MQLFFFWWFSRAYPGVTTVKLDLQELAESRYTEAVVHDAQ